MKVQTNFDQLQPQPIKWLSNTRKRELEEQNIARINCGLEPIQIKLRRCLACSEIFESIERRLCGCTDRQETHMMSHYEGL